MALSGKTLCFTGKLELTRADAKKQAEGAGATVTGTMTAKTDTLVAGPGAGAKLMEAASKGITVWTEQDFIDALKDTGGKKRPAVRRRLTLRPTRRRPAARRRLTLRPTRRH